MSRPYSTKDLIQILAQERQACMNGERLNLAAMPSGINPLLDRFVNADGIQRFTAYNDFRTAIHHYQHEHQVSGIVWEEIVIHGHRLSYPKVDDHLVSLPSDVEILKSARSDVLNFWCEVTVSLDLYLSLNGGKLHRLVTIVDVDRIIARSEWACLSKQGKFESLEIILQLGWGKPEAALYRRGFPESGSEYVHAMQPGRVPIG
jgi:hypothetical protein